MITKATADIEQLVKFLEGDNFYPVFGATKEMGWITEDEWNHALAVLSDRDYETVKATLAMFVLLAEGEEF